MKLKPGFDDELQPKIQGWLLPVRSIGPLMVVVLACALTFAVLAGGEKRARNVRPDLARIKAVQVEAFFTPPRDPFVVSAAEEIDPKMVVPAPAGIDEAMVFNPYTRERQSEQAVPAQGNPLVPFPGDQSGQMPGRLNPPQWPTPAPPH